MSTSLLMAFIIISHSAYIWYNDWRNKELRRLKKKAMLFLLKGYTIVDSIPPSTKKYLWYSEILPQLKLHWISNHKEFQLHEVLKWPKPADGTSYESNLTRAIQSNFPKLFSTNYEVQALVSILFDSNICSLLCGRRIHWRLMLLTSPINFLMSIFDQSVMKIQGNDHGWNLINWPQSDKCSGQPIPLKAHIDGGERFHYKRGIPVDPNTFSKIQKEIDLSSYTGTEKQKYRHRLTILSMLFWQIAIMFYCDTPGDLGPEEGATGFYPESHWAIVDALNRIIDDRPLDSSPIFESEKTSSVIINYSDFTRVIKLYGTEFADRLRQETIPDGKALLCFGLVAHTMMWATKPMMVAKDNTSEPAPMPRSIQNSKITGPLDHAMDIIQIVKTIKSDSLIARFAEDPRALLESILKEVDDMEGQSDITGFLQKESDFIYSQLTSHSP